jgi:hypothetical protein
MENENPEFGTGFFVYKRVISAVKRAELLIGCPTYNIKLKSISDRSG